jgi:hypothetical protein
VNPPWNLLFLGISNAGTLERLKFQQSIGPYMGLIVVQAFGSRKPTIAQAAKSSICLGE